MRRPFMMALSAACAFFLTAWQPYAPPEPPEKVAPRAWEATASEAVDVIVTAQGLADLAPARALQTKEEKTRFVVDALIAHADRAQTQLRADLAARGMRFYPLWVSNQILIKDARRADLQWLSDRADIARVELDERVKGIESVGRGPSAESRGALVHNPTSAIQSPDAVEWGVQRVNAPQAWALGYTGQGIVVANLDTGVYWNHNALRPQYRGWNGTTASHDYNWFDPTAFSPTPVDVNGHGTHTVGTSVGDDGAGNQIGVAPGAQWIACRNMAGPQGIGSVALYTACFQFALAPTDVGGNNPNPALGADITSNSWGCDPSYNEVGCEVPTALVTVTQVLRDAGVMVVASAGNTGSGCSSVNNAPATLDQSLSIGATDSSNVIAPFSSRGPSTLTGRIKPDLVAPGVGVRSSTYNSPTSYGFKSGTSMAAPHVAGVAALLWSAAPWLRGDVDTTEALLRATAQPLTGAAACGGVPGTSVPNNIYGHGLVNAEAALLRALGAPATSAAPAVAAPGQVVNFSVAIENLSPLTRTNVIVTSSLPASATLVTFSPGAIVANGLITWPVGEQAPSSVLTLTFGVSATQTGILSNGLVQLSYDGLSTPLTGRSASAVIGNQRTFFPVAPR